MIAIIRKDLRYFFIYYEVAVAKKIKRYSFTHRTRVLLCLFALVAVYLLFVLFRMQVFGYGDYQSKVLNQITVGSSLSGERGEIYDRNGVLLAGERTAWRIYVSPVRIKKASRRKNTDYAALISQGLSEILPVSYDSVYEKTQKSAYLDQTVCRGVDEETYRKVIAFAKDNELGSMIAAEAGSGRYYPLGTLAAHTIGFTGSDAQGLFGLEAYYNSILSGTPGKYITAVDSQGTPLPIEYGDFVPGEAGVNLITTLDVYIQSCLESCLEQACIAADAQNRVTGIAINPKNGDVLAMATYPSFDLNHPYILDTQSQDRLTSLGYASNSKEYRAAKSELLYTMWGNKAVNEIYEPGSTFKIVTVSAALESGTVRTTDRFSCPGYHMVGGCRISCHKRGGHGLLTFAEGLQQSCNPAMMQSIERVGKDRFYQYFSDFGYLKKTGIDLPGEALGIFHSPASIGSTELATTSFGQRFKVSILQQLCAVSTVANGGIPITPHLLSEIRDSDGKLLYRYEAEEKPRVISEQTANTVCEILEKGVSGGAGAKNAYVAGYGVAAKTGTSEKFEILDANGRSYLRIGSCVGFAPYNDAAIAVIIVVDEPTSTIKYGSAVAAPYVSLFLSSVLPYLGIEPSEQASAATVEDLSGLPLMQAKERLTALGFSCHVIGKGSEVLSQCPVAGSRLAVGGTVVLYTETEQEKTTVPSLVGKSLAEANELLRIAGLQLNIIGAPNNQINTPITVLSQDIPSGTAVPLGTVITLTVLYTDEEN